MNGRRQGVKDCNQRHQHEQRCRGMKVSGDNAIQGRGSGQHDQSMVFVGESDRR